jgi:hypothetical protein
MKEIATKQNISFLSSTTSFLTTLSFENKRKTGRSGDLQAMLYASTEPN